MPENLDVAAVAKYRQQMQEAFESVAEGRDCSCGTAANPFCKTHNPIEKTHTCSECGYQVGSQHFCWGTTAG